MKQIRSIILICLFLMLLFVGCEHYEDSPETVEYDLSQASGEIEIGPNTQVTLTGFNLSEGLYLTSSSYDTASARASITTTGNNDNEKPRLHEVRDGKNIPIPDIDTGKCSFLGSELGINGTQKIKYQRHLDTDFMISSDPDSGEENIATYDYLNFGGVVDEYYYIDFENPSSPYYKENFDTKNVAILNSSGGTGFSLVQGKQLIRLSGGLYDFSGLKGFGISFVRSLTKGRTQTEKILVINPYVLSSDNPTKSVTNADNNSVVHIKSEGLSSSKNYRVKLVFNDSNNTNYQIFDVRGRDLDGGNREYTVIPKYEGTSTVYLRFGKITEDCLFNIQIPDSHSWSEEFTLTLEEDNENLVFTELSDININSIEDTVIPFKVTSDYKVLINIQDNTSGVEVVVREKNTQRQDSLNFGKGVCAVQGNSTGFIRFNSAGGSCKISLFSPQNVIKDAGCDAVIWQDGVYKEATYNGSFYTLVDGGETFSIEGTDGIMLNSEAIFPGTYWTSVQYPTFGRLCLEVTTSRLEVMSDNVPGIGEVMFDYAWETTGSSVDAERKYILAASGRITGMPATNVVIAIKTIDIDESNQNDINTNTKIIADLYFGENPTFNSPTVSNVVLHYEHVHDFIPSEDGTTATCYFNICNETRNTWKFAVNANAKIFNIKLAGAPIGDKKVSIFCDGFYMEVGKEGYYLEMESGDHDSDVYIAAPLGYSVSNLKVQGNDYTIYLKKE